MHEFKIYINHSKGPTKGVKIVKQGWSWPAFLFVGIWLLIKRLWLVWLLAVVVPFGPFLILAGLGPFLILAGLAELSTDIKEIASGPMALWYLISPWIIRGILGSNGNRFWEKKLLRLGYVHERTILARNKYHVLEQLGISSDYGIRFRSGYTGIGFAILAGIWIMSSVYSTLIEKYDKYPHRRPSDLITYQYIFNDITRSKVVDWQTRERQIQQDLAEITTVDTLYENDARSVLEYILAHSAAIHYASEEGDHWLTSLEFAQNGYRGDCEDISIYVYSQIRKYQIFRDSDVTIRAVGNDTDGYHALVTVYTKEGPLFIDNGELMAKKDDYYDEIVVEFNLFAIR